MNAVNGILATLLLSGLPVLASGYAFGTAAPDGKSVQQNQVTGRPVIWYNPRQSFVFNFGGDYDDSAVSAMNDWNAVGTSLQWLSGSGTAYPCNSTDHINSAGWRADTCDNTAFGDAIAITKRSYEKIGSIWYLSDTDIVANDTQLWNPHYNGALRVDVTGKPIHDFRRVILHELGHALGLDHPDDSGQNVTAIMNSRIDDIDSLQQDDKNGIIALYSPVKGRDSNSASQIRSTNGGGGGGWVIPLSVLVVLWFRIRIFKTRK